MKRALVFRIGSLGDSLVSFPALSNIRSKNSARQTLLTNIPVDHRGKAVAASSVYELANLFDDYISYPISGSASHFMKLAIKIRASKFDELIYLMPSRSKLQLLRDYVFFRWVCGIKNIKGLTWAGKRQESLPLDTAIFEHESSRLMRLVGLSNTPQDWQTIAPKAKVDVVPVKAMDNPYLVVSLGTKAWVKDWEDENWTKLLDQLSRAYPKLGLVFVGSADERGRCDMLAKNWHGPVKNTCGELSVKQSLQVLKAAVLYIGHDSGPIHLAAAADTPIVGIYSSHNKNGKWFPLSNKATVFYKNVPCKDCRLNNDCPESKACILSISVSDVIGAAVKTLDILPALKH